MQFVTRAYNSIRLNSDKGTITKISKDPRLQDEYKFYSNIPKNIKLYYPELISFTEQDKEYNLELEYFPFQNIGQILFKNDSTEVWTNICLMLKYILSEFSKVKYSYYSGDQVENFRHEMFIEKTEKEYNSLKKNFKWFADFTKHSQISINSQIYWNFDLIWPEIKEYIFENLISKDPMTFMHGDMCFSNMLCGLDPNNNCVIKLIDPRGAFGVNGNHGDQFYDLAKLLHSVDGRYEEIIYDKFIISEPSEKAVAIAFNSNNADQIHRLMKKHLFDEKDYLKIKIIEGLIFVGMCARHYDSLDRQKVMYCTGIRILNECLNQIKYKTIAILAV